MQEKVYNPKLSVEIYARISKTLCVLQCAQGGELALGAFDLSQSLCGGQKVVCFNNIDDNDVCKRHLFRMK